MRRLEVAPDAQDDIDDLLERSEAEFGDAAAARYRLLIDAALIDLLDDPERLGTRVRSDVPVGLRLYHLRSSLPRVPTGERVGRPRHILAYRFDAEQLSLVRVLYDGMDLPRWLAEL